MDGRVVTFGLIIAMATGALCSLAPAFAALRTNLVESLKDGCKTATGSSNHSWLRSALVVFEIAIALILLTVSGVFLRSFQKMRAIDPGFRSDHVLVAAYQLPLKQYATSASVDRFNIAVVDNLAHKSGIVAVGITDFLPAMGAFRGSAYTIEGVPTDSWHLQFASLSTTHGDYFRTMGIPLLDGRFFTMNDRVNKPLVVIVNSSMARHAWLGQRAIGRRIHVGNPKKGLPWATVVGVVADTTIGSRDEESTDQWYAPAEQSAILFGSAASGALANAASGYITLRSAIEPEQMTQAVKRFKAGFEGTGWPWHI
jgi:putative ABC transport system permease protein